MDKESVEFMTATGAEKGEVMDNAADWGKEYVRPTMRWLPDWVVEEYLDFLWELIGPDGRFRDDAEITGDERISFYEAILGNPASAPVWTTLQEHRWLAQANIAQSLPVWSDEVHEVNLVGHLLQAAHMSFRGFTSLEAMKRSDRDELGHSVEGAARELARGLNSLWLASAPDESAFPFPCTRTNDEIQSLLNEISEGAKRWTASDPVLLRPGKGNAARRYFIVSMAEWFNSIFTALMDDGTVQSKRLDNATTALVNCLYPDDITDQSTVAKMLGVKVENSRA